MARKTIAYLILAAGFIIGAYIGLWLMVWWGALNLVQGLIGQIHLTFFEFLWNFVKVIAGWPICIFIISIFKSFSETIKGSPIGFKW